MLRSLLISLTSSIEKRDSAKSKQAWLLRSLLILLTPSIENATRPNPSKLGFCARCLFY
jgi:hypothetical protein